MNYISAAIHVNKFLSQHDASPSAIVTTLKQVQKQMKKLIGRFKPPTSEELAAMEKWLSWEDVIKMCEVLFWYEDGTGSRSESDNITGDTAIHRAVRKDLQSAVEILAH